MSVKLLLKFWPIQESRQRFPYNDLGLEILIMLQSGFIYLLSFFLGGMGVENWKTIVNLFISLLFGKLTPLLSAFEMKFA